MSLELVSIIFIFLLALLSYAVFISSKFLEIEAEILHSDEDDFYEVLQILYEISSKMDLILNKTVEKKLLIRK